MWPFKPQWQVLSEAKRAKRDNALLTTLQSVENKQEFLRATTSQIVANIDSGKWTASQVVAAFISQAIVAQKQTNCLTEILFQDALEQAQLLDAEFAATKQLRGPLHGVPVSIKDQFHIAGYDSSIGNSDRLNKPASQDADLVALLKAAGAVIIVKTNVPQTMFSFECCNPIWGRTTNPYNSNYTCGGSSGGEAALLALDGSALGVGSDIGGSLRYPAAFCGIYALKPGPSRISYAGAAVTVPGYNGVASVAGPMARTIDDLETFCRLTLGVPGRSLDLAPLLYREPKMPSRLRFGYYTDAYYKGSPAVKRAVMETVVALRAQGHECVEIEVPTPSEAFDVYVAISSADGYRTLLEGGVGNDPLDSSLLVIANGPNFPRFLRNFVAWAMGFFFGDTRLTSAIYSAGTKPVAELWKWLDRRDKYNTKFYAEVWDKHQLDGIIAPVQPMPQIVNDTFRKLFSLASGSTLYNVVNSPAGCVPVTKVDAAKDALTEEWTKAPTTSLVQRSLYQGRSPMYDPVKMAGMPISIQVVGKKWEEEKVLAMMRVVDEALGPREFGPGSLSCK
uniref:Amidase n=1 Tax=Mycena chlorophos TaxID=658473 RepID=A0ABQ0LY33_MYCCL|nr:amidase [Mycena chlorophos]